MSYKFSIIIPCYNCEKTLREAVESCFQQGFLDTEFEIVMVDDGSSDATRTLIEQLTAEYDNIRGIFHETNMGGGSARNTAVAHSSTDIIFCLDSDDILPPNNLIRMYNYLNEKHCDAVCFHHSINFKGTNKTDISHVVHMAHPGELITFEDLFQRDDNMCSLYQVFMFTKVSFYKAGGYPTTHGFDTQNFAWRFMAAGLTAYTCPDTTYLLRVQFKQSYYLREYESGKNNFNWQLILSEHTYLFNEPTQLFIKNFNCSDFTRNIFSELIARPSFLRSNYQELLGTPPIQPTIPINHQKVIPRGSIAGWYLRIKNKLPLTKH